MTGNTSLLGISFKEIAAGRIQCPLGTIIVKMMENENKSQNEFCYILMVKGNVMSFCGLSKAW